MSKTLTIIKILEEDLANNGIKNQNRSKIYKVYQLWKKSMTEAFSSFYKEQHLSIKGFNDYRN